MKKLNRIICAILTLSIMVLSGCNSGSKPSVDVKNKDSSSSTSQVAPTDIAIVSASSGGTAYYIVAGQTTILNDTMEGYTFTNESSTGAPNVNCPYASSDPSLMAYTPFDGLYAAIQGDTERGFQKPLDNIGFVYGGHTLYLYFVTLAESGITDIADLAGKRISLPPTGTTGYYQSLAVLKAYGLEPGKNVEASPTNYTDASDALKDGALDAIIVNGGANQSTVTELDSTRNIVLMSISNEVAEQLNADYPYWTVSALPEGRYTQQPEDLMVINGGTCLIANMELSDELVYEITKTLLESTDKMAQNHVDGAAWNLENSVAMIEKGIVPIHPGAEKYYKEVGAIK